MAVKTHPIFFSFTGGELSPKLEGRVDLTQYANGVKELKNFICLPQGGAKSRGGFHFVAETKDSGEARLIPFVFSELQNYMIEFGDRYLRFFTNKGQIVDEWPFSRLHNFGIFQGISENWFIPYEITSPYNLKDDLWLIRYAQTDEDLYLIHPKYPPYKITRISNTDWSITQVNFIDGPYEDEINTPAITPSATTGNIGLDAATGLFDPLHVGVLWRIKHTTNWGYVKITEVVSSTHAHATVISALDGFGTAAARHREGSWSAFNGYPRVLCFHEGRLLYASSYEWPQTIWGSKTRKYNDMTPGTLDNDAYSFTIAEQNIIRWLSATRLLCVGSMSGESTAVGPSDGPITTIDPPRIKSETTHGSSDLVGALRIGKATLFLQQAGKKIREFVYAYTDDAYSAPDLTIASDHLFELGIIDLCYQQEPDSIIWAITTDEYLLGCTYDRAQNPAVVGWHKHSTDGYFESISPIPYGNSDQLWAIIRRIINNVTKRYIEYSDPQICVDSGLTYSGSKTTTLTGMEHLEGKTVEIVGDEATYPSQIVPSSGELIINPGASDIYVGLGYTPKLVTNRPEVQIQGTSQGLKKQWNKIIARVLETKGIKINGKIVPARSSLDPMDTGPTATSGDIPVENLGWDTDGRITIEQPLPLPAHIVAIFGTLSIGND